MDTPSQMYINGTWMDAADGRTLDVMNPADEEVIGSVPVATAGDLDAALDAAELGWKKWREVDAWSRSRTLRDMAGWIRARADEIAVLLTEEQGKPLPEARGEVNASAEIFDWFADEARRIYGRVVDGHSRDNRLLVVRQPVGPVAAFSPWNFPVYLAARKIAPAVAAGCSIIIKPAEEAPRSALMLARACHEAAIPAGVVNVVTGVPAEISTHLIRSPIIRKVSFTGSVPVGQQLLRLCADGVKRVAMELGGHSPVLVFEDADVETAAEMAARAKYRNNGQVCIAASRFYVHEPVMDRFLDRFVSVTRSLRIGNGKQDGIDVGPLANRRRLEATISLVEDALSKGASLACGGKRPERFARGFYFEPTVLTRVTTSMRIMKEEPFCPVAPIVGFADLDDAIEKANATEYGLAAYVFTQNTRTAFLASERLDVGMVGVNHLLLAAAETPFGGVKKSGFGREAGAEGIEDYTVSKTINIKL